MSSGSVEDGDLLLRRVVHSRDDLEWHADLGRYVPSLKALNFKDNELSTFSETLLTDHGDGFADVATVGGSKPEELAYSFSAGFARKERYEVVHDDDGASRISYAHVLVNRPASMAKGEHRERRSRLQVEMNLCYGEITLEPPLGA